MVRVHLLHGTSPPCKTFSFCVQKIKTSSPLMLNEDGAVPSIPCWTSNGFFSLTTRPGLTLHRKHYGEVPRLIPLESIQSLSPFDNASPLPDRHPLFIPSNEFRTRILGRTLSKCHGELTPDQSELARALKRRRKGLSSWQEAPSGIVQKKNTQVEDTEDENNRLREFDNMLPLFQRKAWISFPSSLSAPIPFSTVRSAVVETDLAIPSHPSPSRRNKNRVSRNSAEAYRRRNLLTRVKAGNADLCVFSPSGRLGSITGFSLQRGETGSSSPLQLRRYTSCKKLPDIMALEEDLVIDITASSCADGDETARFIAATSNSICLARISSTGTLSWDDVLDVPNVRASAMNPLCPEQFSVLSTEGLFSGTADDYRAWQKSPDAWEHSFHEIQCLSQEAQFRQLEYGTHPCTLLLASRSELVQVDLRARRREHRLVLFDLQRNPQNQARGSEVGTFCLAPNCDGFRLLLATRASLMYIDTRMPEIPLLDWSLVLPSAPDKICAHPLNPDNLRSDIVVLASSRWGHAEVFHALHTEKRDTLSPFHTDAEQDMFALPRQQLLWSDLPLQIFSSSPYTDSVDGITVMTDCGDCRATVLQWSDRTGLTIHPFKVAPALDREDCTVQYCSRTEPDNSVNLRNSTWSLGPFSQGRCFCDQFPVSRSVPGSYLHSRVKRLLLKDVKELKKRICSDEADDKDREGSTCVPRPYMLDLVTAETSEGHGKSGSSVAEAESSAHRPNVHEAAQRDDTADRETIIGEAALLRSEESEDSDHPEGGSLDFIDAIGSGCLFDELSRSVRSGFGHHPMPLGVSTLKEAISDSPLTNSYEIGWHTKCDKGHSATSTAVSTADVLPSWLSTTVYFAEEAEQGESLRNSSIPESSQYGSLLKRMQTEFFS